MPRQQNTDNPKVLSLNGKRKSVSARRLRERKEAGEDVSDQRALVRLGVANTQILTGYDDLSDWDIEELKRGYRKDKNGRFQGKAPVVIPRQVHQELTRRILASAQDHLRDNLESAVQVLTDIAIGADVEDKDRLKAVSMIMDRVMGKTPDKVEISASVKAWEQAVAEAIVPAIDVDSEEVEEDDALD